MKTADRDSNDHPGQYPWQSDALSRILEHGFSHLRRGHRDSATHDRIPRRVVDKLCAGFDLKLLHHGVFMESDRPRSN